MADDDEGTPSFGEVVKAFTPPGTDFEEFKRALHSQGAPGMISPEMVAVLNHSGIGEAMAQTGPACPRCDHPHGGLPGKKCLEAEAHLGRSPLRRSPDLQLDEISGPRRQAALPAPPADDFPPGVASEGAVAAWEMYTDFRRAGMSLDVAVRFAVGIITSHSNDSSNES
jgi:hypothetical protein